MTETEINIILADDHTLFRDAMLHYISRKLPQANVFLSENFEQAYETKEKNENIHLVVLDFCMPGMNGFDGLQKFKEKWPDLPIAIISGVATEDDMEESLRHGAIGFFPKTLSGESLIHAIQLVLSGEKFVPVDFVNPPTLKKSSYQSPQLSTLTKREQDVLKHLVSGASNKEIARDLGLEVVTIKLHMRSICRKLNVSNRTQAAVAAQKMGFGE